MRYALTALLLLTGAGLWATVGQRQPLHLWHLVALGVALVIWLIPLSRRAVQRGIQWINESAPGHSIRTWLIVSFVALIYLYLTGEQQNRFIGPQIHDEHMHLLQMQMLAQGKLWTPPHELADFFESFHIFVKPVYASIYFPGTALMYLPTVWLSLPIWVMPLIVASASVGMLFLIMRQLIDAAAAIVSAVMILSLDRFEHLSLIVLSHSVFLMLGLLIVWAWLHWRENKSIRWAIALGALCGWAAITRPLDALFYAAPMGAMLLWDLRRESRPRQFKTIIAVMLAASPFLALQIVQNVGLTGKAFTTPYRLYADLYTPRMTLGFRSFDPSVRPATSLPQRQIYYDQFTVGGVQAHRLDNIVKTWTGERFPVLVNATLPHTALLLLFPLGLLGLNDRRRLALWLTLPLFIAGYAMFAYFLTIYPMVIAPAVILTVLLGMRLLGRACPVRNCDVLMTLALLALSLASLPQFDPQRRSPPPLNSLLTVVNRDLPAAVQQPAIVLFRFTAGENVHDEPVYNVQSANPDDAPIIRAHDLGDRNIALYRYYAKRQPTRSVYLFDRRAGTLTLLGSVKDLARVP